MSYIKNKNFAKISILKNYYYYWLVLIVLNEFYNIVIILYKLI